MKTLSINEDLVKEEIVGAPPYLVWERLWDSLVGSIRYVPGRAHREGIPE